MIKRFSKYILGVAAAASLLVACDKDYPSIVELDNQAIQDYISKNNLNMTRYTFNDTSEFYYEVVTPGAGAPVEYSQKVPLVLTFKSLDGAYSSVDTFGVENRYAGYLGYYLEPVRLAVKEVLTRKNGKVRLILPSRFAFGRNGSGDIPGNASLDITVSVLDENKMPAYEDFVIQDYLQRNNLTGFTRTTSGIYYKISAPGTESPITGDSTVTAKYVGKFLSGKVFDKNDAGIDLDLSAGTILGWKEALPLIKQGGSIRFVLPSSLSYGFAGAPDQGIPAFSPLDFDVTVTDVKP
ncbi:MAG TPA: FKBP-type peptidyl-prolyl cis-trans isomerase [Sphingobacteriaceae bacterium]